MRGDELADRILNFSVRIVKLCKYLDEKPFSRPMTKQLVRSGTSVGANYEEARGAESDADFTHKLSIALKEMRDTIYWLKLIQESELVSKERINDLQDEAGQICAILISSIQTMKNKLKD